MIYQAAIICQALKFWEYKEEEEKNLAAEVTITRSKPREEVFQLVRLLTVEARARTAECVLGH